MSLAHPIDQAKTQAKLKASIRSKALDEYGRLMHVDPFATETRIAMERFILAFRAEHEAHAEVFRAIVAAATEAQKEATP